ncbi:MAG: hypothetical protein Q8934_18545 [Bacillota bacterium]|nr:hypothetical protein [Bacillota bacterium]
MQRRKRLLLLFCCAFFLFAIPSTSFAASQQSTQDKPVLSSDKLQNMKPPDYGERFTASIFVSIADTFINLLGAQDVSYLVFQRDDIAKDNWLKDGYLGKRDQL